MINVDPQEIAKFGELAHRWWDPTSEFKPLHDINPLRLDWIAERVTLAGARVIDVGCGGGILAEAMAARGALVKGIDLSQKALAVAELHRIETRAGGLAYELRSAEEQAAEEPGRYEVVTCMEMLEHVPDPGSVVQACAQLAAPGGHVFFSTLNRNPKSYLYAVLGAEYVLRLLPRGTHDYGKFIKPSELARASRAAALDIREITGMQYSPISQRYRLGPDASVNYILHAVKA
jgi:2-polyprenyl-6-hydroxyphenyl methylase/3-demethylubiquinone-9 3-methyltransferase